MKKILIMIASYGDPDLINTMENAIKMASCSERIYFAVCFQDSVNSIYYTAVKDFPRTKVIVVPTYDSKGVCYARNLTGFLYDGEDYILQIDSHNRFVQNWDEECIKMLSECPSPKCYLTAYCEMLYAYDEYFLSLQNNKPIEHIGYTLCADYFLHGSFPLLFHGSYIDNRQRPYRGAFASGHFIFAPGRLIEEVAYDPNIYFYGEEISFAVRSYTHGWDIFHPYKQLCYHEFDEAAYGKVSYRPKHSDEHFASIVDELSKQHVTELLSSQSENRDYGKYGLGRERTLEAYQEFSGVDFDQKLLKYKAVAGFYESDYEGPIWCHSMMQELEWTKELSETILPRDPKKIYEERYCEL